MTTNVMNCQQEPPTGGLAINGLSGLQVASVGNSEKGHRLKQRFEVIRKLGKGTYGTVKLAINKETGQEVSFFFLMI